MALHLLHVLFSYVLLTQVAEGNIDDFDCVDIYKQPAFQHPLLKHHKIQENFSSYESFDRENKYKTSYQSCPKGTVAILREKSGTESFHPNTFDYPRQHFAVMETIQDGSIYRGAQADITLHNLTLTLRNNQYSKSQIWLENGPPGELNSIQVGWAVHPGIYRDSSTRFTIYWTADGYDKTGCYNTKCPGFVVLTRKLALGGIFGLTSVYGTDKTAYFTPHIFQDPFSGNWALEIDGDIIGYWPKELFTHLNNGASSVRFGGNTYTPENGISPPMGNGHFPVIDFQKSSGFIHVKITNHHFLTFNARKIIKSADSKCFRVLNRGFSKENGQSFTFGGPGGNCGV